ncbi:exocyst complex component 3-like protein isoform X6 [Gopherus flavomarginatus]|uniref:exocyst complex component 3-like protein isoform X6 n=1 Tax=Gopherus flavomarginatus TaxID=286002 RepID=UPI0021CBD44B|nr:exocyst complex component 3-like protein isoform X6 [Gopherus flavomarginatus]
MGMSAEQEEDSRSPRDEEWPEAEKAEKLARGAALKWASGVFYRPDKLEGLGHYRSREAQRNSSIQSRLKSTVQSHLEGVSAGLEQLRSAAGDVRSVRQDLCAVRWHLLGSAEGFQRLAPLRAVVTEHAQLAAVVRALPQLSSAWRQRFYQVMQETIAAAHFKAAHVDVKGLGLGRHLATLQSNILVELRVVKDLMVQCCPPHYNILSICTHMYHQGLSDYLQDILSRDLDKQEIFMLLSWVLHVYQSPEMMGHPDLLPEVDVSTLGPLVSPEVVEQMERKYVGKVKASVTEWMRRTLEVELKEWFREEEPEMDHLGFFQSALPIIVMQMLDENIRVASLVTDSLQQKVYAMAMDELEAFLISLREALGECGKEHQKDRSTPKHYISYLLALLNNNMALSSSISTLHPGSASLAKPAEIPSSLQTALDRAQKKACRLLLEELLLDLQPLYVQLPSRKWLSGAQLVNSMCEVIDKYMRDFSHVRNPVFKFLLAESEHLVMNHYVRALMEKKMVCRSAEERIQLSTQLLQDASQLQELFHNLVREAAAPETQGPGRERADPRGDNCPPGAHPPPGPSLAQPGGPGIYEEIPRHQRRAHLHPAGSAGRRLQGSPERGAGNDGTESTVPARKLPAHLQQHPGPSSGASLLPSQGQVCLRHARRSPAVCSLPWPVVSLNN